MPKFAGCVMLLAALALSAGRAHGQAFDSVRKVGGKESVQGTVSEITKEMVTLKQGGAGLKKEVPVNEILTVVFAGEPADLSRARVNAANGNFDGAKQDLAKINVGEVSRAEITADIDFFKAYCDARMALSGAGSLDKARAGMLDFLRKHGDSFHFYESCQVAGDLAVAQKKYEDAAKAYGAIAKASYPEFKMQANVLLGRAAQAQNNHTDAVAKFDAALAISGAGPQALAATLGKAVSLAATNKTDEALALVATVIEKAQPEEVDLNARAYNAQGACYQKAGKTKDALRAYLKVHLLYYGSPEAHAEALANLSDLWTQVGKEDRAKDARDTLKERYPQSVWAGKVGG